MKKIIIFTLLAIVLSSVTYAQNSSKSFIRWNKAVGIGVGYTNMFQEFTTQYEGISAPQDLIHFDFTIYGAYIGVDARVKNTGYDVFGYDEQLGTWAIEVGPSFRIGRFENWRCIFTPYVGATFYTLSDTSNNSIGARDEYGAKETKFLGGYRIAAAYDWYYISFHFSTRELGFSVGIDFEL